MKSDKTISTVARRRQEKEFKDWVDSMPKKHRIYVNVLGFKFVRPKWWDDQRKLVAVINMFKFITLVSLIASLMLMGFSLSQNVKQKNWQLYTFDQEGSVKWIRELKKL